MNLAKREAGRHRRLQVRPGIHELLEARRLLCEAVSGHIEPAQPFDSSRSGAVVLSTDQPPPVVPVYHSRPEARTKLFLDLDGYLDPEDGPYEPYDFDGDRTTFSPAELAGIEEIWARVSEKYSPFDVDVTTEEPANLSGGTTLMVRFGGLNPGAWGVGINGSFLFTNTRNWVRVFCDNEPTNFKVIAEVAAHESGHGFGLVHQSVYDASGNKINEYNSGDFYRAPIMGWGGSSERGLWWYGRSGSGFNIWQPDMSVIARPQNGFGYRPDDHADDFEAATHLGEGTSFAAAGIIEDQFDVDVYSIDVTSAAVLGVEARAAHHGTQRIGMLDAGLSVLDSQGQTIASASGPSLDESLALTFAPGRYYVRVAGAMVYGDVGQYTLHLFPTQAPFPGPNPTDLPGQIELENYDAGGEELAYHDVDSANQGGAYRTDGVDIYAGVETVVGQTNPGEWLEYTVNVTESRRYDLKVRARALQAGNSFHLELDGADISGPLVPHDASSDGGYGLSTKDGVYLPAGAHVLRVVFDQTAAGTTVGDFDWLSFTPSVRSPFPGPDPAPIPGTVQMENYDRGGLYIGYNDSDEVNQGGAYRNDGVDLYSTPAGTVVGSTLPGEWLEYTITVPHTATYDFELRCGVDGPDAYIAFSVIDGLAGGWLPVPDVNTTGDLEVVRYTGFRMTEGQHVLRVAFTVPSSTSSVVGEFDWFRIVPSTPPWWLSPSPGTEWFFTPFSLLVRNGAVTLTGDAASTHPEISIEAGANARVNIEASQSLYSLGAVNGGQVSVAAGANVLIRAVDAFVDDSSTLDLNDNDMILEGASWNIDGFRQLIARGRAEGAWTGTGITSSSARVRPDSNTTIGLMSGPDYRAIYGEDATFHGIPVGEYAVILKYTYYGDADLNGTVDFDDFVWADAGFNTGQSTWRFGDFDGNGTVDWDDFVLIDLAFNTQTGLL